VAGGQPPLRRTRIRTCWWNQGQGRATSNCFLGGVRREQTAYRWRRLNDLVCGITLGCAHLGQTHADWFCGRASGATRSRRHGSHRASGGRFCTQGRWRPWLSQGWRTQLLKLRKRIPVVLRGLNGDQARPGSSRPLAATPPVHQPSRILLPVCADIWRRTVLSQVHGLPAFHTRRGVSRENLAHYGQTPLKRHGVCPDRAPALAAEHGLKCGIGFETPKPWSKASFAMGPLRASGKGTVDLRAGDRPLIRICRSLEPIGAELRQHLGPP